MEYESDNYTNYNWCSLYSPRRIIKETGGNKRKSGDYPINYIIDIGQNTEKSPGYSRRHAVAQNPVKGH